MTSIPLGSRRSERSHFWKRYMAHWKRLRRHRHVRVACPKPPVGHKSWLRGRRRSTGVLLTLHYAAVLLRTGPQTSTVLYNVAFANAQMASADPSWYPKEEVFFGWLRHHRIARRVGRDTWVAGLRAPCFAIIPNRLLVYRLGRLILSFEGVIADPPNISSKSACGCP